MLRPLYESSAVLAQKMTMGVRIAIVMAFPVLVNILNGSCYPDLEVVGNYLRFYQWMRF